MLEVRQEFDRLHYELERNRRKLHDLREQQGRVDAMNAANPADTDVETIKENLSSIDQQRVGHELTSDQLKHMCLASKADILIQHENMQVLKEQIRFGRQRKERLAKEYENLSKECDKYWSKIVDPCY